MLSSLQAKDSKEVYVASCSKVSSCFLHMSFHWMETRTLQYSAPPATAKLHSIRPGVHHKYHKSYKIIQDQPLISSAHMLYSWLISSIHMLSDPVFLSPQAFQVCHFDSWHHVEPVSIQMGLLTGFAWVFQFADFWCLDSYFEPFQINLRDQKKNIFFDCVGSWLAFRCSPHLPIFQILRSCGVVILYDSLHCWGGEGREINHNKSLYPTVIYLSSILFLVCSKKGW